MVFGARSGQMGFKLIDGEYLFVLRYADKVLLRGNPELRKKLFFKMPPVQCQKPNGCSDRDIIDVPQLHPLPLDSPLCIRFNPSSTAMSEASSAYLDTGHPCHSP